MTARIVLIACATGAMLAQPQRGPAAVQVFTGFTLIDPAAAQEVRDAVLVVRNGRVEAAGSKSTTPVPPGAQTTDLAGKYVVPGFISSHVHISDVQGIGPRAYTLENTLRQLGVYARYGITTVLSLGGEEEPAFRARDAQDVPSLNRARIALAGTIVTGKTADEARAALTRAAASKPDIIKIRVDDNLGTTAKMPPEAYRAVIEEAHRRGLRVAAHVFYLEDAKRLLRAGVDMIAHSVRDKDLDDEFIALMKQRNVPYCPTLTRDLSTFVYESTPGFFADKFFLRQADPAVVRRLQEPARQQAMRESKSAQAYKAALRVAQRNLKRAADAGLLIVLGTDSGPSPERFEGYFEHVEMVMMAQSGLTPAQVLRAATVDAARGLHRTDVGQLTKGAWADFVVLDRSPLTAISNTRSIVSVHIAGNEVASK